MKNIGILLLFLALASCEKSREPVPANGHPLPPAFVITANEGSGTLSYLDPGNGSITTVDLMENGVMYMPHNVQTSADNRLALVTAMPGMDGMEEQLIIIRNESKQICARIPLGLKQHLAHVITDEESEKAWVTANMTGQLIEVDIASGRETKRYELGYGRGPHGLRKRGDKIFIANMNYRSLSVLDLKTGETEEIFLDGMAVQVAVSNNHPWVWITLFDKRQVVRYHVETGLLERLDLPGALGPVQIYPSPSGKLVVCDQGLDYGQPVSDKVYILTMEPFAVERVLTAGAAPHGVVVTEKGDMAWITNRAGNSVTGIDLHSMECSGPFPTGGMPNGISLWYPVKK